MNKVYFRIGGGLGDCLNTFFGGVPTYAQGIKDLDPTAEIAVLCCSSNSSIVDIFDHHPAFNRVILVKPFEEFAQEAIAALEAEGFRPWAQVYDHKTLAHNPQKVYLTAEEEAEVELVRQKGPYTAVHPFNSAGTGITAQHFEIPTDYNRIIGQIINAGYNLAQIGHDWTHNPTGNLQKEEFLYDHPNFINLVNKFNLRQMVRLVQGAEKFLGTSSCWTVVATLNGLPSFMILPEHMKDILYDEQVSGQGLRGTLIHRYGLSSGAAIPELYDLVEKFLRTPASKRTPQFEGDYLVLR